MADRKITDLTALTTPASADVLPIVDVSEAAAADKNKKITVGELFKGVPDGTAAAPAIAFESDDGNGIFLSTTDTVGIATNGSSRMTVSTTAVTSTLPVIVPDGTAAAPSVAFTGSGTDTGVYSPGVDQVAISTGGSGRLFVNASGNVGVGEPSPSEPLEVDGNIFINTIGSYTKFLANNSAESGLLSVDADSNERAGINFQGVGTNQDTAITFSTSATVSTMLERMRIDTDGNLGLGTSGPQHPLHVVGTSLVTGDAYFGASRGSQTGFVQHVNIEGTDCSLQLYQTTTGSSWEIANDDTGLFRILNGGTDRFDITSSGNVGIGTTSPQTGLQVGDYSGAHSITIGSSSTTNGAILFADGTTGNEAYRGYVEYKHTNDVLVFGTGGADKATIDGSGRLLVGTSSSYGIADTIQVVTDTGLNLHRGSANTGASRLDLSKSRNTTYGSNTIVQSGDTLGSIVFRGDDGTDYTTPGGEIKVVVDGTPGANDMPGRLVFSTTADGASSPTERMRLNSEGRLFLNADSVPLSIHVNDVANNLMEGYNNGTTGSYAGTNKFLIQHDGDVRNTNNSYGAISDIKLKENIVDAGSQWDDLKAIQVRKYNFKEETGHETHTQLGVIAQEVELVSPGLVNEAPDKDVEGNDLGTTTKAVNYSVLYMKAVKALQEAMERIETLEAKVAALEGN